MIRIDDVRALRHDLHMRPFEADRRVYLVLDADRMNEDAADALAQGSRGAAAVRGDRARRERARPAAADDPLALPARAVPTAVRAGGSRVDRGAGARAERGGGARRSPARRRAARPRAAAARSGCSRAARRADRGRPLRLSRTGLRTRSRGCRAARCGRGAGRGGERSRAGARRQARPSRARRRAARASGAARAPSATSSWPGSRASRRGIATSSSWRPEPRPRSCTPTGSTICARTRCGRLATAPSRRPRPCARRGARSRSSTSIRRSRSRRCSSASAGRCASPAAWRRA